MMMKGDNAGVLRKRPYQPETARNLVHKKAATLTELKRRSERTEQPVVLYCNVVSLSLLFYYSLIIFISCTIIFIHTIVFFLIYIFIFLFISLPI